MESPSAVNPQSQNQNLVYGRHPVIEALKTGQEIEKILILNNAPASEALGTIRRLAKQSDIPVLFVPRKKLDRLSGNRDHQGIVGILSSQNYVDFEGFLFPKSGKKPFLLVCDHIEDPQNLGSLLRTGDAFGVTLVIIPTRRAAGLTSGAAKASAGAIAHVPVARVVNLHQTLLRLRKEGFQIVGADQSADVRFNEFSYHEPIAIVLGNEHKGLSLLIKNTCTDLVKIPMRGHLDSLNVSVAGALLLHQVFSQCSNAF